MEWLSFGRPSTLGLISGAVAGLVGITPASGSVGILGALCIGGVAGVITFFASTRLKEAIDVYDDALDAFGVHAVGGITGALLTGVWCAPGLGGVGFGTLVHKGGRETHIHNIGFQLGVQAASVAFAIAWVVIGTLLVLKITDLLHGGLHFSLRLRAIRVDPEVEMAGLDEGQFKESGYNLQSSDLRISVEVRAAICMACSRCRRSHHDCCAGGAAARPAWTRAAAVRNGRERHAPLHRAASGRRGGARRAGGETAQRGCGQRTWAAMSPADASPLHALHDAGGVVDLVGSFNAPHAFRTKDVSVHGSDDAGRALRAADVEMGSSVRRGFAAAHAVEE